MPENAIVSRKLNTWNDVVEVVTEAMERDNRILYDNEYYYSDTEEGVKKQTQNALDYFANIPFSELYVYYSEVNTNWDKLAWKARFYEMEREINDDFNRELEITIHYFVYLPRQSRVMAIYTAPYNVFTEEVIEHNFEQDFY